MFEVRRAHAVTDINFVKWVCVDKQENCQYNSKIGCDLKDQLFR